MLIAGPCQIESHDHTMRMAEIVTVAAAKADIPVIFKASYDKANRTSGGSPRGVGIDDGLRILERVKSTFGIPVTTDVHTPRQAQKAGAVVDLLQIPAFLCRQTDLLDAAGTCGQAVNIKKGQFLDPAQMKFAVEKAARFRPEGAGNVLATERGTFFGYNDLVVDMRNLVTMKDYAPVVFDATHSVQKPGAKTTGGDREMVAPLARAAVSVGIAGLFVEVHDDPDNAPSDGPNMLTPEMLDALLLPMKELDHLAKAAEGALILETPLESL